MEKDGLHTKMMLHAISTTLVLRDKKTSKQYPTAVNVVWAKLPNVLLRCPHTETQTT